MSRFSRILAAGVLAVAAAATGLGCGDDVETPEALTLRAFHGLSASRDGCSQNELPNTKGTFDAYLSSRGMGDFTVYLALENNLRSNEDLGVGRLNTNGVQVESYEIRFERDEPWGFLPEVYEIKTGTVINTSERYFAPVAAIPRSIAQKMIENADIFSAGPVDLRFSAKAKGKLRDGQTAISNELGYTVTVCDDCFRPCGGGPIEAMCIAGAQPDGYKCTATSSGGSGSSGGDDGAAGGGGDDE